MNLHRSKDRIPPKRQKLIPTVSVVFNDGTILEMVYQPTEKRSPLCFGVMGNGA